MKKIIFPALLLAALSIAQAQDKAPDQSAAAASEPQKEAQPASANAQAPAEIEDLFNKMANAFKTKNYQAFIDNADPALKELGDEDSFEEACDILTDRLNSGYETSYMGVLNKGPYKVYYWRATFKEGDDALLVMSTLNGKAGGFLIE